MRAKSSPSPSNLALSGGEMSSTSPTSARSVTDLDLSPHALAGAKRNFALNDRVPAVARCPLLEAWAGLRPGSPDGIPILGETALAGYWLATGHFKNGILLAPASAALLADVLTGQEPALPLAPFSPARFGI